MVALAVLVNERHLMGEIPQEEFANIRSVPESFHLTLEEFSKSCHNFIQVVRKIEAGYSFFFI